MSCHIYECTYPVSLRIKPEFSLAWGGITGELAEVEVYGGFKRYGLHLQDTEGQIVLRFFTAKELEQNEGSLPFNPELVCYNSLIKTLK